MEVVITNGQLFEKILKIIQIEENTNISLSFTNKELFISMVSEDLDAKITVNLNKNLVGKIENSREINSSVGGNLL
jgi:hypothetical protein